MSSNKINLRDDLRNCTTHGLAYIFNNDLHWFERAFWRAAFFASIGLIFILLLPLYSRFVRSPTVMSVEMDYFNWNVSFPAVTLCPVQSVDEDAFKSIVKDYKEKTKANLGPYLRLIAMMNIDSIDEFELQFTKNINYINPEDYAVLAASMFKRFNNGSHTTNNNWPMSVEAAMTEMGMCHVINSNVAVFDNPFKWRDSTAVYAKNSIELSIHDADFFTQIINYDTQYKVFIHSPDEVALSGSSSYVSSNEGFLTFNLEVWSTRISNNLLHTPIPMRKCRFTHEPISKRYPVYSYNHCMLECRIQFIVRQCGCVPHFYKALDTERTCSLTELSCVLHYKREFITLSTAPAVLKQNKGKNRRTIECGCENACEVDAYLKDVSFVPHPTISLRVGITTFPKVRVVRDMIFGIDDIIVRSGGVTNLCVGSSLISLMEFFVIGLKILIQRLHQLYSKRDVM